MSGRERKDTDVLGERYPDQTGPQSLRKVVQGRSWEDTRCVTRSVTPRAPLDLPYARDGSTLNIYSPLCPYSICSVLECTLTSIPVTLLFLRVRSYLGTLRSSSRPDPPTLRKNCFTRTQLYTTSRDTSPSLLGDSLLRRTRCRDIVLHYCPHTRRPAPHVPRRPSTPSSSVREDWY